jgi:hypothetical protein
MPSRLQNVGFSLPTYARAGAESEIVMGAASHVDLAGTHVLAQRTSRLEAAR